MRLAGSFPDAKSAIAALQTHHADVLVMDLSMPGMGGLLALQRLRELAPHVRVVLLSAEHLRPHGEAALQAGASAYLQKPAGAEELLQAIRTAAAQR
jgi:two-component system, NarL family, invasion response regulator UvrY